MVKPPRNQKGGENPIRKWWLYCGRSANKDDKRFEDLIQTNGGEEGCDDETKWTWVFSNKGKDEGDLYELHYRTQCRLVITQPIEEGTYIVVFSRNEQSFGSTGVYHGNGSSGGGWLEYY